MNNFTHINQRLLVPMAFILPVWLTVGRALLGSAGWLTIVELITVCPVLLASLLVLRFLARDKSGKFHLDLASSLFLTMVYIATILHGVFLVDFDDSPDNAYSIALRVFGSSFQSMSTTLAWLFFWLGFLALVLSFGAILRSRLKRP